MTKEEKTEKAINFFKIIKKGYSYKDQQEFFDMAIEALKQQSCKDNTIDQNYWKGFNNGIRTEKFRESKRQKLCKDAIT